MLKNLICQKSSGIFTAKIYKVNSDMYPYHITIKNGKTGFIDYPIMYEDGHISYDHPEKLPKHAKELSEYMLNVSLVLLNIDKNGKYFTHKWDKYAKFLIKHGMSKDLFIFAK